MCTIYYSLFSIQIAFSFGSVPARSSKPRKNAVCKWDEFAALVILDTPCQDKPSSKQFKFLFLTLLLWSFLRAKSWGEPAFGQPSALPVCSWLWSLWKQNSKKAHSREQLHLTEVLSLALSRGVHLPQCNINRIAEQPRLEWASEDHQVQPLMGKEA